MDALDKLVDAIRGFQEAAKAVIDATVLECFYSLWTMFIGWGGILGLGLGLFTWGMLWGRKYNYKDGPWLAPVIPGTALGILATVALAISITLIPQKLTCIAEPVGWTLKSILTK